jgi:hypothetical protein
VRLSLKAEVGVLEGCEEPTSERRWEKPCGGVHFPRLGGGRLVESVAGVPELCAGNG